VRNTRRGLATEFLVAREDAGISLRRLARAAGISPTTVGAIERGEAEPGLAVMTRLATALGMSLSVRL
jgi:transcriptional regulator with XRE-family HTH domain